MCYGDISQINAFLPQAADHSSRQHTRIPREMQRKQKDTMWERYQMGREVGEKGERNIREGGSNSNQNMLTAHMKLSRNKFY